METLLDRNEQSGNPITFGAVKKRLEGREIPHDAQIVRSESMNGERTTLWLDPPDNTVPFRLRNLLVLIKLNTEHVEFSLPIGDLQQPQSRRPEYYLNAVHFDAKQNEIVLEVYRA